MKSFKKDKSDYIQKNITSCIIFSKQQKYLLIYSTPSNNDEYYLNIIFQKGFFQNDLSNKRNIDNDLLFVLHLVHNFPMNAPKLFCLSSLSHIGIELCDGKDILENILLKEWNSKINITDIILTIPYFIQELLKAENVELFIGKYSLNYEYDYNLLVKVPHQYFNKVEQIINKKIKLTEKRFLMITSLFFLVFSYEVGYFNYNNLKLIFWGSLFSIYGIKRNDNILEFELNKNRNEKIKLSLITNEGQKIKNILLYILKVRGVGYLIEDNKNNKNKNKDNQLLNERNNNNENKNIINNDDISNINEIEKK
jgi:ubiquitin-protein ligase